MQRFIRTLHAMVWLTITNMIVFGVARGQGDTKTNVRLVVGSNVQVSQAYSKLEHWENLSAGNPQTAGQLSTCSMVRPSDGLKRYDIYCYASFDSGKSWQPTLKIDEGSITNGDPVVMYAQGNDVYAVGLVQPSKIDQEATGHTAITAAWATVVYKSTDGGRTFKESSRFQFIDREYITIDRTAGKYAGRIYIVGITPVSGISGAKINSLHVFHSDDGGTTFQGPTVMPYPEDTGRSPFGCVVLSDGTFVVMFLMEKKLTLEEVAAPGSELYIISSKDGGRTFSKAQKISDRSSGSGNGQLAADPGSSPFKDRLYAVWPNYVRCSTCSRSSYVNRTDIKFSYSEDGGNTWSKPMTINDDRPDGPDTPGANHFLPSVAVNKDGALLVSWYDRRNAKNNLGWQLYAAASLDGGETFSASVPVAEVASKYSDGTWSLLAGDATVQGTITLRILPGNSGFTAGDTSGLAVDADGTFHPTWIDNRTGTPQLWTAAIRVNGVVARHGGAGLEALEDISKQTTLKISKSTFDQSTGVLKVTAQLQNLSKALLKGPVKVRVLKLVPALGVAEITNSDNEQNSAGAVWDFSSVVPKDGLGPRELSGPKTLAFRITGLRPATYRIGELRADLFNWDIHIYGRAQK